MKFRLVAFLVIAYLISRSEAGSPSLDYQAAPLYDLVILNGKIVDGTGNPWFLGDLAVKGDVIARITPIGQLRDVAAKRRIDAKGLVVAPGFIDIQGHSRTELLEGDGRLVGKYPCQHAD